MKIYRKIKEYILPLLFLVNAILDFKFYVKTGYTNNQSLFKGIVFILVAIMFAAEKTIKNKIFHLIFGLFTGLCLMIAGIVYITEENTLKGILFLIVSVIFGISKSINYFGKS